MARVLVTQKEREMLLVEQGRFGGYCHIRIPIGGPPLSATTRKRRHGNPYRDAGPTTLAMGSVDQITAAPETVTVELPEHLRRDWEPRIYKKRVGDTLRQIAATVRAGQKQIGQRIDDAHDDIPTQARHEPGAMGNAMAISSCAKNRERAIALAPRAAI